MPERLQILVSAVNKNIDSLLEDMNISSDAVIVNQIIGEKAPDTDEKRGYNVVTKSIFSTEKLEALGWKPESHIKDGIKKTIEALQ